MEKKISKKKLESLIYLARQYWSTGETKLLEARMALGKEIENESDVDWVAIIDFIDSIVKRHKGLCSNTDNETIYAALNLFGWDVVSE